MTALLGVLLLAAGWGSSEIAAAEGHEEAVFLFQNRRVLLAVPEGLGFASSRSDRGLISVRLGHPKDTLSMQIDFLPDPDGALATARSRKEFMNETFHGYVASSTEKAMRFEELDPLVGAGTYCVFTDASLVGKTKLPPGEYLHSTTGIKAWPGVVAVFTLFSNDTRSKEYQAVMTMLKESVAEAPAPPRR